MGENYIGNKNIPGLIQKIVNLIPRHSVYWELFAGGGAVGYQIKSPWTVQHFNDIDSSVLDKIAERDPTAFTHSFSAFEILQSLTQAGKETFVFCDPPYLFQTRHSSNYYNFELSDKEHEKFLSAVKLLKCNCMIIHPVHELYDDALQTWKSKTVKIRYNRKTSSEKIYMNYNTPQDLQTYKYIGEDCWQRQGFKRKAERFLKKGLAIDFPEPTYIQDFFPGSLS